MTFGERLTQLRKDNGYAKRNAFAEVLGIPETTLRNYETDVREPGHKFLLKISEIFNVSIDFLLCATDDKEKVGSHQLKSSEYDHIKKYRLLDDYGKETVRMVLDREVTRVATIQELTEQQTPWRYFSYYGRVAAAGKSFGFEDIVAHAMVMELPLTDLNRHADYLIGVSGDSMEPDYSDGDIVYVKKADHLNIGDVGIFQKDNGIYIKEVGENGLISRNPAYKPMIDDSDVICLGKVIGKVEEG